MLQCCNVAVLSVIWSWYPLPEGTVQFQEMTTMKPCPPRELRLDDCQKLTEFARVYGHWARSKAKTNGGAKQIG